MRVLVACEESQRVCVAFREKGHEAYSCDILPCSGGHPEWHIQGDVLPLINGRCEFQTMDGERHSIDGKWDLLIAFPPCTFMTKAGARWMFPKGKLNTERYKKAMQAKAFFMSVWQADCERVVIENPTPLKCVELPRATQSVQPFLYDEFDEHPYSKKTCCGSAGICRSLRRPHRITSRAAHGFRLIRENTQVA